ncbi:MAG TPA: KUP/HAK/KT family potassium transporter [Steroidobacteraceae bacterium]|nr:KUP/HAK/KT family potassium transporter [Steroidobacteraceae bacterium]
MQRKRISLGATLGAIGVVYGDIGTSPLYALEQSLNATGSEMHSPAVLLGVLSLMFWSLLTIVTIKYVMLIMRADNAGEGGILSLFALVQHWLEETPRWGHAIIALAVMGAALFYCDALITPAISVLGAVEGLELLDPGMTRVVVPVTLAIIVVLFAIQHRGTERVGRLFAPIMVLWFMVLAYTGATAIAHNPQVLIAVNPYFGLMLLVNHQGVALAILGGVFLTVTGGEALYADMGSFGKGPVRLAWFGLVWPALLLSYFGQGALVLTNPSAAHKPLFALVPETMLPWMVLLATLAAIIASQATITGAFSVTRQAVQLDLLPRLRILQTSAHEHGHIFVPVVNVLVLVAVCVFVVGFGSSDALGSAYGAAVAGTMSITTLLGMVLASSRWRWASWKVALTFGPLLVIDLTYGVANLTKFRQGAWVPLLFAILLYGVFMTWRSGRRLLRTALRDVAVPLKDLPAMLQNVTRVPGTGVFLVSEPRFVPTALLRSLEHYHVVHERVVFLNMEFARTPRQDPTDRVRIDTLLENVFLVTARFGFMETPDVSAALKQCRVRGLKLFGQDCSFFLGWHLVRSRPRGGYEGMRRRMFAWMQRRSTQAVEFFRMPDKRVIILATEVEL